MSPSPTLTPPHATNASGKAARRPAAAPRAWLELALWRHGAWWLVVPLLLAAALALAWQAEALRTEAAQALPAAPSTATTAPTQDPAREADQAALRALRAVLAPYPRSTTQVRQLIDLTQPALAWQRAEFQPSEENLAGIARLQITVPVSGNYPGLRKALARALLDMPNLSLDQVMLHRQHASDSTVDARLRFSLWLRPASPVATGSGANP